MKFLFLIIFITACASKDKSSTPQDPIEEYSKARILLNQGDFESSISVLEKLDRNFPYGPVSSQVQLDLIYAYYKIGVYEKSLALIDRFLRNNPYYENNDYVYYMRGISNLGADYNNFQALFKIKRDTRDRKFYQDAFNDFNIILSKFPNSIYADDAYLRALDIKNSLAKYEIAIANYYIKRNAYLSAINRANYVLENFYDTPSALNALRTLEKSYAKLNNPKATRLTRQVIDLN